MATVKTVCNFAKRLGIVPAMEKKDGFSIYATWNLDWRDRRVVINCNGRFRVSVEEFVGMIYLPWSYENFLKESAPTATDPDRTYYKQVKYWQNNVAASNIFSEMLKAVTVSNGAGRMLEMDIRIHHAKPLHYRFVARVEGEPPYLNSWGGDAHGRKDDKGVIEQWVRGEIHDGELVDWVWDQEGW